MKEEVEEKSTSLGDDSNDSAPPQKKWRSPPFSDVEKMMLAERYAQNYVDYNLNVNTMSSKCETGLTRASLLRKWSEELTAVGVSLRTPAMVEQKIRDYIKKITKYNNKLDEEETDSATKGQTVNGRALSPSSRLFFETLNKPTYRRIRQARSGGKKTQVTTPPPATLTNGHCTPNHATHSNTAASSPSPAPSNNATYSNECNDANAIDLDSLITNSASTSGSSTDGVHDNDAKSTSSQAQNHNDTNHHSAHQQNPSDVFANLLATLQNGSVEESSIDDDVNAPGSKRLDDLRCELMKQKLENARIDRHIKMVQLDIMRQQLLLFKQTTGSLPS